MAIKCKIGDMCIVTHGEEAGKICTILDHAPAQFDYDPTGLQNLYEKIWVVDIDVKCYNMTTQRHYLSPLIADEYLCPLNPTDEEDEILRMVGKPSEIMV